MINNVIGYNDNFSKTNNLVIEPMGCVYCMEYNWDERKEKPKEFAGRFYEGEQIKYCPFCGRKVI